MPTLYTHYSLGNEVLNKVNKKLKTSVLENKKYYDMFNQGFDNLFYYHFKWSYYRKFAVKAHKNKIEEFFTNTICYLKENNLIDNSICTNFLYGFINHYTLDTIMHPLINYQKKALNIPHTKIEYMFDGYLLKFYHDTWHNSIYQTLIPKVKFDKTLINLIDNVFMTTHHVNKIGKIFKKSHRNGYYIHRYFICDNKKIKHPLYHFIDILTPKKDIRLCENTFCLQEYDNNILNAEHKPWLFEDNTYNYSLTDLYNAGIKIATKLNNLAFQVLHNQKEITELITLISKIHVKNIQELLL